MQDPELISHARRMFERYDRGTRREEKLFPDNLYLPFGVNGQRRNVKKIETSEDEITYFYDREVRSMPSEESYSIYRYQTLRRDEEIFADPANISLRFTRLEMIPRAMQFAFGMPYSWAKLDEVKHGVEQFFDSIYVKDEKKYLKENMKKNILHALKSNVDDEVGFRAEFTEEGIWIKLLDEVAEEKMVEFEFNTYDSKIREFKHKWKLKNWAETFRNLAEDGDIQPVAVEVLFSSHKGGDRGVGMSIAFNTLDVEAEKWKEEKLS